MNQLKEINNKLTLKNIINSYFKIRVNQIYDLFSSLCIRTLFLNWDCA